MIHRCSASLLVAFSLIAGRTVPAQMFAPATSPQSSIPSLSLEILSDTNVADLNSYLQRFATQLREHWLPMVQAVSGNPGAKREETTISITIMPDGELGAMRLDPSTHRDGLNKAAWSAIQQTSIAQPPPGLKDGALRLRVHFFAN